MGNDVSSESMADAPDCDEEMLEMAKDAGWSAAQVNNHVRVFHALYEGENRTFEYTFANLRSQGVPGAVLHRLWLFLHYLSSEKHQNKLNIGDMSSLDLDEEFGVLPQMVDFDPETDEEVWNETVVRIEGGVGGASQTKNVAPAKRNDRVQYAVYDQFERASGRMVDAKNSFRFFAWLENMTSSKRRKFVFAIFSVRDRIYPGYLLRLGYLTTRAFGASFTTDDLACFRTLIKYTPRHHLNYTEFCAWWKLNDLPTSKNSLMLLRSAFSLLPHFQRVNRNLKMAAHVEGKDFSGKVRVDHDVKSVLCVISGGLMKLNYRAPRVIPLRGAFAAPDSQSSSIKTVIFQNLSGERLRIKCASVLARNHFIRAVRSGASSVVSANRFASFHQERDQPVSGRWFVDGADYFETLMNTLLGATREILIADWCFQPEVYLFRGPGATPDCRLDYVLRKKASEGVQIYILQWWEVSLAVGGSVDSQMVEAAFKDDPNIHVLSHPLNNMIGRWSHHQKFVVVDRDVSFVGGLDLCFGRYDTKDHPLTDANHLAMRWPGKDFYNPNIVPNAPINEPFVENLDRSNHVRQPWHDVQVMVNGHAAEAVAANFAQRWNTVLSEMGSTIGLLSVRPSQTKSRPRNMGGDPIKAQVVRSLAPWSGCAGIETSILNAYMHLIEHAEHFIYIENQFFITSFDQVINEIGIAIVDRIIKAIEDGLPFRVVIVVPLHSEGEYNTTTPRILTLFTHRTFQKMQSHLAESWPQHNLYDFVSVHCVMQHGQLNNNLYLSMIYVHTKLIIADDRFAIVGSANINDRSMMGDRDSEIAVFLETCNEFEGVMDGKPFQCSKMVRDLRVALWKEHLGETRVTEEQVSDPLVGAQFFKIFTEYNRLLVEPIIELQPNRLWRSLFTGLHPEVPVSAIAKQMSDWLQGLRSSDIKDLCYCCKQVVAIPENVCILCDEQLCDACSMTHDSMQEEAMTLRGTRKQSLAPHSKDALRKTLELATEASESEHIICHLCMGSVTCPWGLTKESTRASLDLTNQAPSGNKAEFKLRHLMRLVGLHDSDDVLDRLKSKCLGDRNLAIALLSSSTFTRLQAIRGHIFPYNVEYVPKIRPDIFAAAPKEIFT